MAGRDITEGSSGVYDLASDGLPIARGYADVGITSSAALWQNTDVAYDLAIGGLPFLYAINDARPYVRQTAPFKKDQFDNQTEPGEQSLSGWWIRSQSSFHHGAGIKFFDPATGGDIVTNRFYDSRNVNVWTKGQATLLRAMNEGHITTGALASNLRPQQRVRSIQWVESNVTYDGALMLDGYDVDKIKATDISNPVHFIDYNAGTGVYPVLAICDDGKNAYWVTNKTSGGTTKLTVFGKPLTGSSSDTSDEFKIFDNTDVATNATIEYVKERLVICTNNKVYECAPTAAATPTLIYTHPISGFTYTEITASGSAIYICGYNGIKSVIQKFVLTTTGGMQTLTQAVTAAELPAGERIYSIFYYLGIMMLGTSKGVRAANVSDQDGSITYGPLIVETSQPCYGFAGRDHYVWCATGIEGEPGLIRIDIGASIETLRYAWANDVYVAEISGRNTTSVCFMGDTDRVMFTINAIKQTAISNKQQTGTVATLTTSAAHGYSIGDTVFIDGVGGVFDGYHTIATVPSTTTFTFTVATGTVSSTAVSPAGICTDTGNIYVEDATVLAAEGYIQTGNIRFNTLEKKHFERLLARGDYTKGSMILLTVDASGTQYDHITYSKDIASVEVTTEPPSAAVEYLAYKFELYRDSTDTTTGPVFKGYQAKALIATPRHRIIQLPAYCFDVETDRYNIVRGYEGNALTRLLALEQIEENGDIVTWQDFNTNESFSVVIEQIQFTRLTPPDKRFTGFGGVLQITLRTV